jgi:hypothetical protein
MPFGAIVAFSGFAVTALVMFQITMTKERVRWPGWLIPAAALLPAIFWLGYAIYADGPVGFWALVTTSPWGMQMWFDRLLTLAAAFFLLQNRARAAGMKSEAWVLAVLLTGAVGLLIMLATTVYLERRAAAAQESSGHPGSSA